MLQPFVAGAVLGGRWTWDFVPALGLVLFGFLLREPLTAMAREVWVYRGGTGQMGRAACWAAAELAVLAVCFLLVARSVPLMPLLMLATVGGVMTVLAVGVTLRNRQRSVSFQVLSAAGLGTTALLAALVGTGGIPGWAWWAWGLLTAHAMGAILVVHARLRARAGLRTGSAGRPWAAYAGQAAQVAAAAAIGDFRLVAPLILSAVVNTVELVRLGNPRLLQEPLTRVGYRTLAVALLHLGATTVCLWPLARG